MLKEVRYIVCRRKGWENNTRASGTREKRVGHSYSLCGMRDCPCPARVRADAAGFAEDSEARPATILLWIEPLLSRSIAELGCY